MEKKFQINNYSKYRFLMVVFIPIIIIPIIVIPIVKMIVNENWQLISFIIVSGLYLLNSFKTPKYLAKAILQIICEAKTVRITCLKPFGIWSNQKEYVFTINEVKAYKYEPSRSFETFWIQLVNGEKVVVHRWNNDWNDDFDRFLSLFEKMVKKHNKANKENPIVEKQSIMENKTVLGILAIVLGIVVSGSIFLVFNYGIRDLKGVVFLLIALPSLIWAVVKVVKGLKRK